MSEFILNAEVREERGKEKAKKLRAAGRCPAIVYGTSGEPVSLTIDTRESELVIQRTHGEKVLVTLNYDGKEDKVFLRNIQRDPASEKLVHVDFYRVDLKVELDTQVPVINIGTAVGVKEGGLLEHGIRELAIRCLPTKVPPHIEVDVSGLAMNKSYHVEDLPEIDGVQILTSPDAVLFAVASPSKVTEEGGESMSEEAGEEEANEKAASETEPAAS